MRTAILSLCVILTAALTLPGRAENLLTDPGFETGTDSETFDAAWSKWGNVYHEPVTPRSGHWACKLFGNFKEEMNHSGIMQDIPGEAGQQFKASVYMRHNSNDFLEGANQAWVQIEFRDADDQQLATSPSERINAQSPTDIYQLYETPLSTAPPGTVTVRFVIIFEQRGDGAPGAVFCDDAVLERVAPDE